MVEEMLATCGTEASHETIRRWAEKFGRAYANRILQRTPQPGDRWHPDEVLITIVGMRHWLPRAVDQDGFTLDVLVQSRGDRKAAERLKRKLLKKNVRTPRITITETHGSYGATRRNMGLRIEHRQHPGLNNRADDSHQSTRRRERQMKRFKSARQVERIRPIHDPINNLFHLRRHQPTAATCRKHRAEAFTAWAQVTTASLA